MQILSTSRKITQDKIQSDDLLHRTAQLDMNIPNVQTNNVLLDSKTNKVQGRMQKFADDKIQKNNPYDMKRYFPDLYEGKASSSSIAPKTNIQEEIKSDSERKRLFKASRDFQAIFIGQMLKAMRKNLNPEADPLFGGNRQKIFQDMLYDEYAKKLSDDKRFNLADQIYIQLSPKLGKVKSDIENLDQNKFSSVKQAEQKYSADRLKREILQSNNRLSTDQLFREEDWRP